MFNARPYIYTLSTYSKVWDKIKLSQKINY
jgi:hypothetical protein